jgi:hypothetical protein
MMLPMVVSSSTLPDSCSHEQKCVSHINNGNESYDIILCLCRDDAQCRYELETPCYHNAELYSAIDSIDDIAFSVVTSHLYEFFSFVPIDQDNRTLVRCQPCFRDERVLNAAWTRAADVDTVAHIATSKQSFDWFGLLRR